MKIKDLFKENGILSGKRVLAAVITGAVLIGTTLGVSASGHEWGSKGDIVYENNTTGARTTIFDKSDLEYLDERIDAIENNVITGKESIANELNTKGINDGTLSGSSTFSELANGVVNSQKIPGEGEPFLLDGQQVYKLPSGEITTDGTKENAEPLNIVAANENNLSAGTAAWVDGSLIIGTGADNNSYYNLGYTNGLAEISNSNIEYIYHHHSDKCLGTVTKTCTVTERFTTENHPAAWNSIWCGTCNANTYHDGKVTSHSACGQGNTYAILGCGGHANNTNYYTTYTHNFTGTGYTCGFNEGDIEKAVIKIK